MQVEFGYRARLLASLLAPFVVCVGAGCSTDKVAIGADFLTPERTTGSLIDHDKWVMLDAAADPYASERPPEIICPPTKAQTENWGGIDAFEVDTSGCNYASVGQPSLKPVLKGDTIYLEGWRGDTQGREPAEAHLAITLNGKVLFDKRYPIPWPCGATLCTLKCANSAVDAQDYTDPPCDRGVQPYVTVEEDAPQGAPIVFHVHNHGSNKYGLIKMTLDELAP